MRKEANDFLKICDILDRDYKKTDGNKFRYAKTYLEQNVGPDQEQGASDTIKFGRHLSIEDDFILSN